MRRLIIAILIVLALPGRAKAQYVGVSLERITSTVDWQYPAPPSPCPFCIVDVAPAAQRRSTGGGLSMSWRTNRWLGASTELQLAPRGYAVSQPTLNVSYLEAPTLLRLGKMMFSQLPLAPFLEAGPAVALRVGCRVYYNDTSEPCKRDTAIGQDWRVSRFDVSAVAGVGMAVRIRTNLVVLRGRVDHGLLDVGGPDDYPTKHRSKSMSIAWLAPLPRFAR